MTIISEMNQMVNIPGGLLYEREFFAQGSF